MKYFQANLLKNYFHIPYFRYLTISLLLLASIPGRGQDKPTKGTIERVKVFGKGLEGNLSKDSPDRDVSVYLPPSYKKDSKRRYPVIYFLHGFTDSDAKFYGLEKHWMNLPDVVNDAYSKGKLQEMIIVTPNAHTRFFGSMYSNSVTTGNWEEYVAKELVSYVDAHYRTIAKASSRGLAGHSMGGYGTMRIGAKYPEVFSTLYLLSPCCLGPGNGIEKNTELQSRLESVKTQDDLEKADFFTKAMFASAAAWSPNPVKPPFFVDLPVEGGVVNPLVLSKWTANQPLVSIDQSIYNIRKLNALAFDAGSQDKGIAESIKELDKILNSYGVKHIYEEYEGDHINKVAERIGTKMLNFFSENLSSK
jgi:enterochelin esterase-like enzyme